MLGDLQARGKLLGLCDDFACGGEDEALTFVAKILAAQCAIKVRAMLGPELEDPESSGAARERRR